MRQLFIDLDGVLADFDGFYESQFGIRPNKAIKDPPDFWKNVERHGTFFADMAPMPDALDLWWGAKQLHPEPVILTGLPRMKDAEAQKRDWVKRHVDMDAKVICCQSKDKRDHGKPGDVLVDDWDKYRHLWEGMGGIFVLHTSAAASLALVKEILKADTW